jgi:hypothetical protein
MPWSQVGNIAGPPGAPGPTLTYSWNYDTSTVMADPGNGYFRANAATTSAATALAISVTDVDSADVTRILLQMVTGDLIILQESAVNTSWARFSVSGALVNHTTWFQIPVTFVTSGGAGVNKSVVVLISQRPSSGSGGGVDIPTGDARWVNVSGDTMTGALALAADPTTNLQAATKQYVDANKGLDTPTADARYVNLTGDTMTGALMVPDGTAATQALNTETADGRYVNVAGDTMTGQLNLPDATAPTNALNQRAGDARYVNVGGDTMTGFLTLNADPTTPLEAVTKQYVDGLGDVYMHWVPYTGTGQAFTKQDLTRDGDWTMVANKATTDRPAPQASGSEEDLLPAWTPTQQNARATYTVTNQWTLNAAGWINQYGVDVMPQNTAAIHAISLTVNGVVRDSLSATPNQSGMFWQNITPMLVFSGAVIQVSVQVTLLGNNQMWWSQQVGLFATAPTYTSLAQGQKDGGGWTTTAYDCHCLFVPGTASPDWDVVAFGGSGAGDGGTGLDQATADQLYVNVTGDTMTGALVLYGAPQAALEAATRNYVTTQDGFRVAKAGDTMTGLLTLSGDPTTALQAATKQYVDPGAWQALSMSANWGAYGAPNPNPQYRITPSGEVILRGVIKKTGNFTYPQELFATLPVGARPVSTTIFTAMAASGLSGGSSNTPVRVDIGSDGTMTAFTGGGDTNGGFAGYQFSPEPVGPYRIYDSGASNYAAAEYRNITVTKGFRLAALACVVTVIPTGTNAAGNFVVFASDQATFPTGAVINYQANSTVIENGFAVVRIADTNNPIIRTYSSQGGHRVIIDCYGYFVLPHPGGLMSLNGIRFFLD